MRGKNSGAISAKFRDPPSLVSDRKPHPRRQYGSHRRLWCPGPRGREVRVPVPLDGPGSMSGDLEDVLRLSGMLGGCAAQRCRCGSGQRHATKIDHDGGGRRVAGMCGIGRKHRVSRPRKRGSLKSGVRCLGEGATRWRLWSKRAAGLPKAHLFPLSGLLSTVLDSLEKSILRGLCFRCRDRFPRLVSSS